MKIFREKISLQRALPGALLVSGTLVIMASLVLFGQPKQVNAAPADLDRVEAKYTGIVGSAIDTCTLCHTSSIPSLNPYGTAYKNNGRSTAALTAIEPLDFGRRRLYQHSGNQCPDFPWQCLQCTGSAHSHPHGCANQHTYPHADQHPYPHTYCNRRPANQHSYPHANLNRRASNQHTHFNADCHWSSTNQYPHQDPNGRPQHSHEYTRLTHRHSGAANCNPCRTNRSRQHNTRSAHGNTGSANSYTGTADCNPGTAHCHTDCHSYPAAHCYPGRSQRIGLRSLS